jgi:hypothetical protein
MKRVLLYEPGLDGHRPVILRYLVKYLPENGICPVVCTDVKYAKLDSDAICGLLSLAERQQCEVLHLLTIDGAARSWLRPDIALVLRRIKIVGSYYLYNNLYGARGVLWELFSVNGYFDRLFVSDPGLRSRNVIPQLRSKLHFVPDPWDPSEFLVHDKNGARRLLKLPEEKVIFLVFGISLRKGVHRILDALRLIDSPKILIVFAGVIMPDAVNVIAAAPNDPALVNKIRIDAGYIREIDMGLYFSAADAVICDYPKEFLVSSGVFTRCLAAGVLPIFPAHGGSYDAMRRLKVDSYYESESVVALSGIIRGVLEGRWRFERKYLQSLASARHAKFYAGVIASGYLSVTES